jgi:hypothetical protein
VSETIEKLRPDRDLQCYFFRPTAIAALSQTSANGYHVSGTWRQQFDWAVIEWNRDSVFEHPTLRPLPDGDLSGLALSYRESRTNCIALDSTLFPTVDWPFLRIWANDESGDEQIYRVRLSEHKTATAGSYAAASATFTLGGSLTEGDVVEMSWLDEHYFHTITSGDSVDAVLTDLADAIDGNHSHQSDAGRRGQPSGRRGGRQRGPDRNVDARRPSDGGRDLANRMADRPGFRRAGRHFHESADTDGQRAEDAVDVFGGAAGGGVCPR